MKISVKLRRCEQVEYGVYPRTSTNKSTLLLLVSSCLRLESSARGERRILTILDEEGGIHGRASGASNRFSSTTKNRDLCSVGPSPIYRQMEKESINVNVSCQCDVDDNMQLISGRRNDRSMSIFTNVD